MGEKKTFITVRITEQMMQLLYKFISMYDTSLDAEEAIQILVDRFLLSPQYVQERATKALREPMSVMTSVALRPDSADAVRKFAEENATSVSHVIRLSILEGAKNLY